MCVVDPLCFVTTTPPFPHPAALAWGFLKLTGRGGQQVRTERTKRLPALTAGRDATAGGEAAARLARCLPAGVF